MGVKYILLNFALFMLAFFALGFTICAFGDCLGIYRHECPLALWYNFVYLAFSSGLALLFIGEPVQIQYFCTLWSPSDLERCLE
jgi:hypothetical protein